VPPTVTVNEHELMFPLASVAVHVTVVVPSWNVEPDGGTHATVVPAHPLSETVGAG
jgi:hypothetical protein